MGETLPVFCFVLFCFCGLNAPFNDSRRLIDKFGRGFASSSCGIADSMIWVHLVNERHLPACFPGIFSLNEDKSSFCTGDRTLCEFSPLCYF